MIVPRETYVLIEVTKDKPINTFLELPEELQAKRPPWGKVIAIGPKVREVAVGDIVHFERFDWSVAAEGQIILKEEEILCVER